MQCSGTITSYHKTRCHSIKSTKKKDIFISLYNLIVLIVNNNLTTKPDDTDLFSSKTMTSPAVLEGGKFRWMIYYSM